MALEESDAFRCAGRVTTPDPRLGVHAQRLLDLLEASARHSRDTRAWTWEVRFTTSQTEPKLVSRAERTLSRLTILVPRRVRQEEIGDALEVIASMEAAGCSRLKIILKVWSTIFMALVNGLREFIAGLTGRK